jgi:pyruvate-formate lyase-activating enzyme
MKNFYVITTFKCNCKCAFCLFRKNEIEDCDDGYKLEVIEDVIRNTNERLSIKITGGEPFIKPKLVNDIITIANSHKDKIHNIGIGTNGTLPMPLMDSGVPVNVYASRHTFADNAEGFGVERVLSYEDLLRTNAHSIRLSCNIIKGGVDTTDEVLKYLHNMESVGLDHICFRELNRLSVDNELMYEDFIYDYLKYYKEKLVSIKSIMMELNASPLFSFKEIKESAYDSNYIFLYKDKIRVKFRVIREDILVKYNKKFKGIDEYVLHPDGLLTGCWDRNQKIIKERR